MVQGVGWSPEEATAPMVLRHPGDPRSRSVWQWQLIFAFITVAVAVAAALLIPTMFADWRFNTGLVMVVAITLSTLAIPWHQIDASGVLIIPLLDITAVGFLNTGSSTPVAFLWVFPVAWVATYYRVPVLIGSLSMIATFTLIGLFDAGISVDGAIDAIVLLLVLGFISIIVSVGSERNRSARALLRGQSARIGHALRRVTEQKARNRRLLDSLNVGIARVGSGGILEISNRTFHTLYALDESSGSLPSRAVEYSSRRGEPVPASQTTLARASRGELFADDLVWLFGLDGQWRALKASTRAIEDGSVANDGVLLVVEDVTESLDPDAGREATRRTISHELRNPLTAIVGHIDLLLERDDLTAPMRSQLEVVERASDRMQGLIDQALSTTPRSTEDCHAELDLTRVVHASIEAFSPAADSDGIVLDIELAPALPLTGDAFRLRQVVDNILGNAIKYAQHGGKVTVRGYLASLPDATAIGAETDAIGADTNAKGTDSDVVLEIGDNGIGISSADLPRIFDRDFRTELARESGIPGTGLGLSISRAIVTEHAGRLDVTSELGQGTTVTMRLPTHRERSST